MNREPPAGRTRRSRLLAPLRRWLRWQEQAGGDERGRDGTRHQAGTPQPWDAALTAEVSRLRAAHREQNSQLLEATRRGAELRAAFDRLRQERDAALEREAAAESLLKEQGAEIERLQRSVAVAVADQRRQVSNLRDVADALASHDEGPGAGVAPGFAARRSLSLAFAAALRSDASATAYEIALADRIAGLFDAAHYLAQAPGAASVGNPLLHYIRHGIGGGLSPMPLMDVAFYRSQRPGTGCPLLDYIEEGEASGARPHRLFWPAWYRQRNRGTVAGEAGPLLHYLAFGAASRLDTAPTFDASFVLAQLGEPEIEDPLLTFLAEPEGSALSPHPLVDIGWLRASTGLGGTPWGVLSAYLSRPDLHRAASPHPLFDVRFVLEAGLAVPEGLSPWEAFLDADPARAGDPHPLFDSPLYRHQVIAERGGVIASHPILHYLTEGRRDPTLLPSMLFDPAVYRKHAGAEADLAHYVGVGEARGLRCHELFCAATYRAQPGWNDAFGSPLRHCLSAGEQARLISDERLSAPLTDTPLNLAREISRGEGEFAAEFYRSANPDLMPLDDEALEAHYRGFGKDEGRYASARGMAAATGLRIADIPAGFFHDDYVEFSPDLKSYFVTPASSLIHYVNHGRRENRLIGRWQFSMPWFAVPERRPNRRTPPQAGERAAVAVAVHMFYGELWPELAGFVSNFDSVSHRVFVNIVDIAWTPELHRDVQALCPGAFVQLSHDSGRDIGGFMRLFDNIDFDAHDCVALIHSKMSPHMSRVQSTFWRRSLLHAFCGSPEIVADAVQLLRDNPDVGIVAASRWRSDSMGKNEDQYVRLCDMFGIGEEARKLEYVTGTMFLVRSSIMKRVHAGLRHVEWEYGGDKDLAFHVDGQIAHGVERFIPALAREMGYTIHWRSSE
jgi:hypothetical protein